MRIRSLMLGIAGFAVATVLLMEWARTPGLMCVCRRECPSNIRQIGLGLIQYVNDHGYFPCGTLSNATLPPGKRLSWYVAILKSIDYEGGDLGMLGVDEALAWDAPSQPELPVSQYAYCPNYAGNRQGSRAWTGPVHYVGITGVGRDSPWLPVQHPRAGIFGYDRQTRPQDIKDGSSNTMLLAETTLNNGPWMAGGPSTMRGLDPVRQPYIGRGRQFGGMHRSGVPVVMADGSVRFLPESIDPKVFEAIATIADGAPGPNVPIPNDW